MIFGISEIKLIVLFSICPQQNINFLYSRTQTDIQENYTNRKHEQRKVFCIPIQGAVTLRLDNAICLNAEVWKTGSTVFISLF